MMQIVEDLIQKGLSLYPPFCNILYIIASLIEIWQPKEYNHFTTKHIIGEKEPELLNVRLVLDM
jgi:hypothetical protein